MTDGGQFGTIGWPKRRQESRRSTCRFDRIDDGDGRGRTATGDVRGAGMSRETNKRHANVPPGQFGWPFMRAKSKRTHRTCTGGIGTTIALMCAHKRLRLAAHSIHSATLFFDCYFNCEEQTHTCTRAQHHHHYQQQQELLHIFNFDARCASSSQAHEKQGCRRRSICALCLDWSNHSTSIDKANHQHQSHTTSTSTADSIHSIIAVQRQESHMCLFHFFNKRRSTPNSKMPTEASNRTLGSVLRRNPSDRTKEKLAEQQQHHRSTPQRAHNAVCQLTM